MVCDYHLIVIITGAKYYITRSNELLYLFYLFIGKWRCLYLILSGDSMIVLSGPAGTNGGITVNRCFPGKNSYYIYIFKRIKHVPETESQKKRVVDEPEDFLY